MTSETLSSRFWKKAMKGGADKCWEWKGNRHPRYKYGRITIDYHPWAAHRLSWEIHYGEIPAGLNVCHICDNPPCVNPDHLFLGTHEENMKDMKIKGRGKGNPNLFGVNHPKSKLTDNHILEIRAKYSSGKYSQRELAKEYKVTQPLIHRIVSRQMWKHVK